LATKKKKYVESTLLECGIVSTLLNKAIKKVIPAIRPPQSVRKMTKSVRKMTETFNDPRGTLTQGPGGIYAAAAAGDDVSQDSVGDNDSKDSRLRACLNTILLAVQSETSDQESCPSPRQYSLSCRDVISRVKGEVLL
jgi:hypothetical protein